MLHIKSISGATDMKQLECMFVSCIIALLLAHRPPLFWFYSIASSSLHLPNSSLPRTAMPPPVLAFHVHQLASLSLPSLLVLWTVINGSKNIGQLKTVSVELELFDASQLNG